MAATIYSGMNNGIDLTAYRAELHQKIEAIDLLLGATLARPVRRITPRRASTASRPRSKMSAAGRARIAAAARARWRRAKAAGRNAL